MGVGDRWVCEARPLGAGGAGTGSQVHRRQVASAAPPLLLLACCFRSLFCFSVLYVLFRSFLNFVFSPGIGVQSSVSWYSLVSVVVKACVGGKSRFRLKEPHVSFRVEI